MCRASWKSCATEGRIGAPLDAEVDVYCEPDDFARFNALGQELRFLLITSEARVHQVRELPDRHGAGDSWALARQPSSACVIPRQLDQRAEVRSLLAAPPRCGQQLRASGDLRPLCHATSKARGEAEFA